MSKLIDCLRITIDDKRKLITWILVSIYIGITLSLNLVPNHTYTWAFPVMVIIVFFFLMYLCHVFNDSGSISEKRNNTGDIRTGIVTTFMVLLGNIAYWLAYYPGGFNLDALGQWDQAHGYWELDNWHPVITTIIYWALTRISDTLAFCIFSQILLFSLVYGVFIYNLTKLGISRGLLIVISACVAINPAVCLNNVCLIKDVYFTIGVMWLSILLTKIYASDGDWIDKWWNAVHIVIASLFVMLTRHNGFLFVLPMLVMLLVNYREKFKRLLFSLIFTVVGVALIVGPVFEIAHVRRHENVLGEMIGIPMGAMVNAYVNDYDNTPEEVKNLLETISEREIWNKSYRTGEWDSCKWDMDTDIILQEAGLKSILRMFFDTAKACPEAVFQSVRENTRIVWQLVGRIKWAPWVYIESPNEYEIKENHVPIAESIVGKIIKKSYSIELAPFIWEIAIQLTVLAICGALISAAGCSKGHVFLVPVFTYAIGTMLLLSGPNYRYFYYISVIELPFLAILLTDLFKKRKTNGKNEIQ